MDDKFIERTTVLIVAFVIAVWIVWLYVGAHLLARFF